MKKKVSNSYLVPELGFISSQGRSHQVRLPLNDGISHCYNLVIFKSHRVRTSSFQSDM